MKKFNGSKLSNRTKVILGLTGLVGIGAVVSAVKDLREVDEIIVIDELGNEVVAGLEEATEAVEDVVSDIID